VNKHVPSLTAEPSVLAQNAAALVSLALTQRRLSWRYRRWALEDEAAGRMVAYRHDVKEARRLWREAKEHLDFARHELAREAASYVR
jgi:hypothetical protein